MDHALAAGGWRLAAAPALSVGPSSAVVRELQRNPHISLL
jgi:hypothetical protein